MSVKPTTKPRWALTGGGADAANIVVPSSGEQDTGFTVGQTPIPSGKTNFLFNWLAKWINFLDDSPTFVPTTPSQSGLTGIGSASGGGFGVVGNGTLGFSGVRGIGNGAGDGISGLGGGTSGSGASGVGGTPNGVGVTGNGTGTGRGGSFTGGPTGGAGVVGVGGTTSGSGSGGEFSGGAPNGFGAIGTGVGNAAGLGGTGGTTGPGVNAVAGGGGTPARGALSLSVQNAPSAPQNGDIWATTLALFARLNSATVTIPEGSRAGPMSFDFVGNPGNTASTTYFAWGGTSQAAVAANGTTGALIGQTTHMVPSAGNPDGVLRTLTVNHGAIVGGSVTITVTVNGSGTALQLVRPAGSPAGPVTVSGSVAVAAGSRVEVTIANGVGVTQSLGLSMISVTFTAY